MKLYYFTGLVIFPTGLMSSSLMCGPCFDSISACKGYENSDPSLLKASWKFTAKYCSFNSVNPWIYYLPLLIMSVSLTILGIKFFFNSIFQSGTEIKTFDELVKKNLAEDDGSNSKFPIEMEKKFGHGATSNFYACYVAK